MAFEKFTDGIRFYSYKALIAAAHRESRLVDSRLVDTGEGEYFVVANGNILRIFHQLNETNSTLLSALVKHEHMGVNSFGGVLTARSHLKDIDSKVDFVLDQDIDLRTDDGQLAYKLRF